MAFREPLELPLPELFDAFLADAAVRVPDGAVDFEPPRHPLVVVAEHSADEHYVHGRPSSQGFFIVREPYADPAGEDSTNG